jgi:hypothetical protein
VSDLAMGAVGVAPQHSTVSFTVTRVGGVIDEHSDHIIEHI